MIACPECGDLYPQPMLVRHREFEHPEEFAAEQAQAEENRRAAKEAAVEEGRFTSDGFLRRAGQKPAAPPTDPSTLLGGLFPEEPGAALPPWERERLSGPS